jgi:bacillithiol system protein YtxJ
MEWLFLTEIGQLDEIRQLSFSEPVVLYKNSTRCSISMMVKSRIESSWEETLPHTKIYYLDLLVHRNISDEIARMFNIEHESPQILVIKDGACKYTSTHGAITVKSIAQNL